VALAETWLWGCAALRQAALQACPLTLRIVDGSAGGAEPPQDGAHNTINLADASVKRQHGCPTGHLGPAHHSAARRGIPGCLSRWVGHMQARGAPDSHSPPLSRILLTIASPYSFGSLAKGRAAARAEHDNRIHPTSCKPAATPLGRISFHLCLYTTLFSRASRPACHSLHARTRPAFAAPLVPRPSHEAPRLVKTSWRQTPIVPADRSSHCCRSPRDLTRQIHSLLHHWATPASMTESS
jgi:hypothetical protein